jgi:hypothetical protein
MSEEWDDEEVGYDDDAPDDTCFDITEPLFLHQVFGLPAGERLIDCTLLFDPVCV